MCLLADFKGRLDYIAVSNLLANNNTSKICYIGQISLQKAAVNYNFL